MSDLRGEGQGWFEALLQRGVEDEVGQTSKHQIAVLDISDGQVPLRLLLL